tara:strand:+ start:624 stop:773 length:150 start_codon:yes stop_codon:yes gene_type:complete
MLLAPHGWKINGKSVMVATNTDVQQPLKKENLVNVNLHNIVNIATDINI